MFLVFHLAAGFERNLSGKEMLNRSRGAALSTFPRLSNPTPRSNPHHNRDMVRCELFGSRCVFRCRHPLTYDPLLRCTASSPRAAWKNQSSQLAPSSVLLAGFSLSYEHLAVLVRAGKPLRVRPRDYSPRGPCGARWSNQLMAGSRLSWLAPTPAEGFPYRLPLRELRSLRR